MIIVASVSCIYGIRSEHTAMTFDVKLGDTVDPRAVMRQLVDLQYTRNDAAFIRGTFRLKGDNLEVFPPTMTTAPGASISSATRSRTPPSSTCSPARPTPS